jgi:hypothetical protein
MNERRPSVGFMTHKSVKGYEIYNIAVNFDQLKPEDLVKNQRGERIINLLCFLDDEKKASPINVDEQKIQYLKNKEQEKLEI